MPYYVYAVRPFAQLERLGEHAAFRDASAMAKALRAERAERAERAAQAAQASQAERAGHAGEAGGTDGSPGTAAANEVIRVMFAETALAAEDLLLQVREAPPPGDT